MKNFLVMFSAFFSIAALSLQVPNYYYCEGENMEAVMKPSMDLDNQGKMMLLIKSKDDPAETYHENYYTAYTPFGASHSLVMEHMPDLKTTHLSILIPGINLKDQTQINFDTKIIQSVAYTSFAGPSLVDGLLSEVTGIYHVSCVASLGALN